ncbi:auxin-responsive GH3 family protein isoform X2 [Wolffia australiana]
MVANGETISTEASEGKPTFSSDRKTSTLASLRPDDDVIGWFDLVAERAAMMQKETLRRIIKTNAVTEYLKIWLGEDPPIEDLQLKELEELFRSRVPLAAHAEFEPYLQRIADGDTSPILIRDPVSCLSLSSGTTDGRPKYIPFTSFSAQTTLQICKLGAAYRAREGGRVLEFIYGNPQRFTKGGVAVGTATTHVFASEAFKAKQQATKSFSCSPQEIIHCGDYKQTTYGHLLLGLFHCDNIEFITSTFAYSVIQGFAALDELWPEICADIRSGNVNPIRVTSPEVRRAILGVVFPDPALALRIESACRELKERQWRGLVPSLWPNAKYILSIMTGSMLPYMAKLRHYAGNVPFVSADYGSSECWIGANIEPIQPPERVTFTLVPTFAYFEFIPLRTSSNGSGYSNDDEPVTIAEVELHREYELVVTTFTGLYRYRLGDVVRVVGFHKSSPKLSFVRRRNVMLAVNTDKSTERDLELAVEKTAGLLAKSGAELVDFTSRAVVGDGAHWPGYYVIFLEIDGEVSDSALRECCRAMDLSFADYGYVVSRRCGSIGPLELCVLEKGTFKEILAYYIGNGGTLSQFKTPRCVNSEELLRILNRRVRSRFSSDAYAA